MARHAARPRCTLLSPRLGLRLRQRHMRGLGIAARATDRPLLIAGAFLHGPVIPRQSIAFRAAHRTAKKRRASGVVRSIVSPTPYRLAT